MFSLGGADAACHLTSLATPSLPSLRVPDGDTSDHSYDYVSFMAVSCAGACHVAKYVRKARQIAAAASTTSATSAISTTSAGNRRRRHPQNRVFVRHKWSQPHTTYVFQKPFQEGHFCRPKTEFFIFISQTYPSVEQYGPRRLLILISL